MTASPAPGSCAIAIPALLVPRPDRFRNLAFVCIQYRPPSNRTGGCPMTHGMKIGIGLPVRAGGPEAPVLLEWAARADAGPFSSLAVTDRVVYRAHEPLVALASAIGATPREPPAT